MTDLPPSGPSKRLSRRNAVRAAFTERLGLKATAIVISILLWLIATARQPTQGYVRVRVLPVLDSTLVLLEPPLQLRALVSGRAVDIVKLYADPPAIHRRIDADAPDTLVLDIAPADVRVPSEFANEVRVLDVQPRNVTLRFGTRGTRRVPVTTGGRVIVKDDSVLRTAEDVDFEPSSVRITGPRRIVRRITSVHPYSLHIVRGDTMQHVADLDTTGLGVEVLPPQVRVVLRRGAP
ncbi:MAG: hypothetical protein ABI625_24275 [bacterium]